MMESQSYESGIFFAIDCGLRVERHMAGHVWGEMGPWPVTSCSTGYNGYRAGEAVVHFKPFSL